MSSQRPVHAERMLPIQTPEQKGVYENILRALSFAGEVPAEDLVFDVAKSTSTTPEEVWSALRKGYGNGELQHDLSTRSFSLSELGQKACEDLSPRSE